MRRKIFRGAHRRVFGEGVPYPEMHWFIQINIFIHILHTPSEFQAFSFLIARILMPRSGKTSIFLRKGTWSRPRSRELGNQHAPGNLRHTQSNFWRTCFCRFQFWMRTCIVLRRSRISDDSSANRRFSFSSSSVTICKILKVLENLTENSILKKNIFFKFPSHLPELHS